MLHLVFPMYNEEKIVHDVITAVHGFIHDNFSENSCDAYFVNDGSTDNTLNCAQQALDEIYAGAAPDNRSISVIGYGENKGKGGAVRFGMLYVCERFSPDDVVLFTDCDLAYGLEIIKQVYKKFQRENRPDLVTGSRVIHEDGYAGYTPIRKLASKTYLWLLHTYAHIPFSDSQSGLKAFTCDAAEKLFSKASVNNFAFDLEILMLADRMHMKAEEIPVKIINHRESHVNVMRDSVKMLKTVYSIKKSFRK